ncbi:hypothetical protein LTR22_027690, partial [Elasticomyces elasticus]
MMNVIGNAMKYSPGGAVVVSLHVCAIEAQESQEDNAQPGWSGEGGNERKVIVFAVKDTGKGMSKDFLENQLFLPFHQEDAVKSEGVGLGMSIVKSLVSMLAGRIEVTSQLGKGSDFKISIAMAAGRTTQHAPGASAIEQSLAILRRRGLTVAVHGVEHATAQSLRAYVHDWFECTIVTLGDEGLQPDIILADGTDNDKFAELWTQLRAYDQRLAVVTVSAGSPKRASSMYVAEKHIWERISRPLGPHKLAKALMNHSGDFVFSTTVLSVCADLVFYDQQSDVVRLVHYTVQQYFEHTWSKWFGDESIALADTCITYLSFDILATGPCDNEEKMTERFENYALLKYTAQYWGDHARDVQEVLGADDTSEVNAALSFVRNKDLVLSAVQAMWTAP